MDENNFIQNCLSGITVIRNKTCFGTAVHLLIFVQINIIPDGQWTLGQTVSHQKFQAYPIWNANLS